MPFLTPQKVRYNKNGLTDREVLKSRSNYGTNALSRKKRATFLSKFIGAFGDPIIKILVVALALNVLIALRSAEFYEPLGIAIALFLATFVGALSEYGSESAFIKLEQQSAGLRYRVMRSGRLTEIDSCDIVVGDTLILSAGERVPADCIVAEGRVFVDTSALSGESRERERFKSKPNGEWSLDDKGLIFCGSVITSGECKAAVGRVGDSTFLGDVAREVQTPPASSPLTKRLERLAKTIGIIGYVAAAVVFFADLMHAGDLNVTSVLHALTLAITVVVVAVPEGLPMMITVVLSSNMNRLKRDNVLVRRLVGIETAGCINMLFCDKTGTLTEGKLSVMAVYGKDGNECVPTEDMKIALGYTGGATLISKKAVGGNATDRALLCYLKKLPPANVSARIPFDSEKKYSAVKIGNNWYIKGAPEVVFNKNFCTPLCNLHKRLTSEGIRVIAMAKATSADRVEILGLVALRDRLRRDVQKSVKMARGAGIRVCMITGDSLNTAAAIAKEAAIADDDGIITDSASLARMSDDEVMAVLPKLQVVARALPSDKSRLTRLSQKAGFVCAMTGDGINDAPALRMSDVGFSMGSGTEVAKQASDVVILDNSFLSIIKAVLYGRTIFKSIRKFIVFQLTINLCAVGVSVIGPFIGIDTPVTVIQMLWINIIMDTLAGLAFAGEAPDERYMSVPPLSRSAQVIDRRSAGQIAYLGLHSLTVSVLFLIFNPLGCVGGQFMSAFFALFVFQGIFAGVCARCPDALNITRRLSKNYAFIIIFLFIAAVQILLVYYGGALLRTYPLPVGMLTKIIMIAAAVVPSELICKILFKKFSQKDN